MESEWGFALDDSFEESRRKVEKALDDPRFVEILNKSLVINSVSDGQRTYTNAHIALIKKFESEIENEVPIYEPGTFSAEFADKLELSTKNLTSEGTVQMEGMLVYKLVDDILFTSFEYGNGPKNLAEDIEIALAAIISSKFKKSFDIYQLDIFVTGQGLLSETYSMSIYYRPYPKTSGDLIYFI